ncbi:hypothetical protein C8J57DRAFT_1177357 [Mycena rebaudengoi]|nr:hypothetical protein C8J57DRAFT_1177357 [Mycena rebaudengoi]
MHFAKTYTQLLQDLPPELRENAIEYRQLKKLINQVVSELTSLGLSPSVLQDLLQSNGDMSQDDEGREDAQASTRVIYELNSDSERIEPRLRLWVDPPLGGPADREDNAPHVDLLWALQRRAQPTLPAQANATEIVIPLASDSAFFQLLSTMLQSLAEQLLSMRSQFSRTLEELTMAVSDSARPVSSTSAGFKAVSAITSDPGGVRAGASNRKSDLFTWREIFQLYLEAEVFESVSERDRGERTIEDSENRLTLFAERVAARGLGDRRKLKLLKSRQALESFLQLNVFILSVKKACPFTCFERANAEARRKILKKHTKRTALPWTDTTLLPESDRLLPRILVQELGTTLLPIIPSLEDYACVICTSIAFKPVRLGCGHLFCVRCLVKMQKRGSAECPMCRTSCVLIADRSNVDWALMNFMRDWFPEESTLKLRQNESEAAKEQLEELGIDPNQRCIVM